MEPIRCVRPRWLLIALPLAGCADSGGSPSSANMEASPSAPLANGADGGSSGDASPASDGFTQALRADLEQQGFLVSQGYPVLYRADDCERFTYEATKNCWLNNPAAPYVTPVVKPWPDEYVDPTVANVMGGVVPGYTGVFRFDPREALVIFGQLPPPGKYFGLQTWVFSREGRWKQSDYDFWAQKRDLVVPIQYLFDTIPADNAASTRVQSFSAISNIINNVVIERQSGGSFGQVRYFVVTPDATMDDALRSSLVSLGVLERNIFTEPIPQRDELGSIGPIGLGKEADDFVTALRYAVPDDPAAADAWRNAPPLTVLRVRATTGAPQPYPLLTFDPRSAVDELGDAQLTSDVTSLIHSVCQRAEGTPWNFQGGGCEEPAPESSILKDLVHDYGWTGPYCRSIGMDCLGDQQDAAYSIAGPKPLDDGEVYAVVGPLGTKTGNATYSALSVNNPALLKGASNLLDTNLAGSANAYSATVKNPDKVFLWFFARDCDAIAGLTDGKCTTITPEMVPFHDDTAALGDPALKGMFQPSVRDYIKPGTTRGPDANKMIRPRVLSFTRPHRTP